MSSTPTLAIPRDVIEPIIQANIAAAIAQALGPNLNVVEKAIQTFMSQKVDSNGAVNSYDSYNKTPWIEWVVMDAIKDHAKKAIHEHLTEHAETLKQHLSNALSKKNSPLAKQLVEAMAGAFLNEDRIRWAIKVDASLS